MKPRDKYLKLVAWSEEDRCYVGSVPGWIDACCHGSDEAEVYRELCRIVDEWIEIYRKDGRLLPPPTNRDYSGRFVLRTGPEMHRALTVRALNEGESLNSFVVKALKKTALSGFLILAALSVSCSNGPAIEEPTHGESILDRVVHIEPALVTSIPETFRWCDRLEGLDKRKVDVGGAELYVEVEGKGAPIVLINGGPGGTHHYFHPWFSRAKRYARVVYYDQRGCGLSDFKPGEKGYSVEQAVEDLEAIRKALGFEKWVVLGYSYGGFLAQLYTVLHPENVSGLILLGASPGMRADDGPSRQGEFVSEAEEKRMTELRRELSEYAKERLKTPFKRLENNSLD